MRLIICTGKYRKSFIPNSTRGERKKISYDLSEKEGRKKKKRGGPVMSLFSKGEKKGRGKRKCYV